MTDLHKKKVAVLATDGFEQAELTEPVKALRDQGANAVVVAPHAGEIQGMKHHEKGDKTKVDMTLAQAKAEDFDALVLPGGVSNPDALRIDTAALAFIGHFVKARKPIAAICHGPWTLVELDAVRGRKVTSWPSLKTDLKNAGAEWVDRPVVVDGNFVTSRKPDDLNDFNRELLNLIANSNQRTTRQAS